jgi:threonine aldolase
LSGVSPRPIEGEYGILDVSQLEGKVRPINDHLVRTRIVCLENTHNRGAGSIYPLEKVRAIRDWTRRHNLILHLDGARLWNAVVGTGIAPRTWAEQFDSVSVCFSKGLGAPVGSALAGPRDFVTRARRVRKLFGGGMRQAGVLAAAALYALDHHVERLADDHRNAKVLAKAVADTPGLRLTPEPATNILIVQIEPHLGTAADVVMTLKQNGVLVLPTAPQTIRMVTHLDVSAAQTERAAEIIRKVLCR